MRFNSKELACIAQEKSSYFDFEGILFVREKSDGLLFKKNKVFVERLFRLKGNLLFYFKHKDKSSDVAGVYVLERCCVQLEEDEIDELNHLYCFSIVFEAENPIQSITNQSSSSSSATITNVLFVGSASECERDRWIELIHISSYECMRFQLQHLQDRLKEEEEKKESTSKVISAGNIIMHSVVSVDDGKCKSRSNSNNSNSSNREVRVINNVIIDKQMQRVPDFKSEIDDDVIIDEDDERLVYRRSHSRDDLSLDSEETPISTSSTGSVTSATKSLPLSDNKMAGIYGTKDTYLKMGVSCTNLPLEQFNKEPDTFVTVHYLVSNNSKQKWKFHGKTEIVEKNCYPSYVSLVTFDHFDVINLQTRLRLTVYSVKERMTNTAIAMGMTEFCLMEILQSATMSSALTLRSAQKCEVGKAILILWLNSMEDDGIAFCNVNSNNNDNKNDNLNHSNNNNENDDEDDDDDDDDDDYEGSPDDDDDILDEDCEDEDEEVVDEDDGDDGNNNNNNNSYNDNNNNNNNNNNKRVDNLNNNKSDQKDDYETVPSAAVLVAYKRYSISGLTKKRRRSRRKTYIRPQVRPGLDLIIARNTIIKTFRFPMAKQLMGDSSIVVNECMSEYRYGLSLPATILRFLIDNEIESLSGYDQLGTLPESLERHKKDIIEYHFNTIANYEQHLKYFKANPDVYFKPSIKKTHREVEFVPTNLHIQSMFVSKKMNEDKYRYDFITVGAFTAMSHKYKHGGLRRMLALFDQYSPKTDRGIPRRYIYTDLLTRMEQSRRDINMYTDILNATTLKGKVEPVVLAYKFLESAVIKLIHHCSNPYTAKSMSEFYDTHPTNMPNADIGKDIDFRDCNLLAATSETKAKPDKNNAINWPMPTGLDQSKGKNREQWDKPKTNMENALQCLRTILEICFKLPERESAFWLERISPHTIRIKRCAEVLVNRFKLGPNFMIMLDISKNLPLYHSLKYRRDVVFSQALTSAVLGFLIRLSSFISTSISTIRKKPGSNISSRASLSVLSDDGGSSTSGQIGHPSTMASWLYQCMTIGQLMQFESLLSCYGDEISMMEDEWVALNDLKKVKLKLEPIKAKKKKREMLVEFEKLKNKYFAPGDDGIGFEISGRRHRAEKTRSLKSLKIYAKKTKNNEYEITDVDFETDDSDMQIRTNKSSTISMSSKEPSSSTMEATTSRSRSSSSANFSINVANNAKNKTDGDGKNTTANARHLHEHSSKLSIRKSKSSKVIEDPRHIEYSITGSREDCIVSIEIPDDVYNFLRADLLNCLKVKSKMDATSDAIFMHESSIQFGIVPVWFTMGINEHATIAEKFFSTGFQDEINQENFLQLDEYFKKFSSLPENTNSGNVKSLDGMMKLLHSNIFLTKKNKNVDILQIASDICRSLNGARFTSCKSAKDRTAMSVTLEQVKLLRREHDLAPDMFSHALDSIRSEGVRRDNTQKNTGIRKYAFNTIQIVSLPKMYRPPKGTFGNLKT